MTRPRLVVALGLALGIVGAAGQLWLMRFGGVASAPLRSMLSLGIAMLIGVIAGSSSGRSGVKVALLMGVSGGAILTIVNVGATLLDTTAIRSAAFSSATSALAAVSAIIAVVVLASWFIAAVAALVAWPLSLASAREE